MTIYYRGLEYTITPTVDTDGTVLDMELERATWTSDWLETIEDIHDLGLGVPFWPVVKPLPGHRCLDGLAALLFGHYGEELRAALKQQIEDCALAVQGATEGGE